MIILRSEDERIIGDDRWLLTFVGACFVALVFAIVGYHLGMMQTTFVSDGTNSSFPRGYVVHRPSFAPGIVVSVGDVIGSVAGAAATLLLLKERRRFRPITICWTVVGAMLGHLVVGVLLVGVTRIVPMLMPLSTFVLIAATAAAAVLTLRFDLGERARGSSIEKVLSSSFAAHPVVPAWIAAVGGAAPRCNASMVTLGAVDRWIEVTADPAGGGFLDLRGFIGFIAGAIVGAAAGAVAAAWVVLRGAGGREIGAPRVAAAVAATIVAWLAAYAVVDRLWPVAAQQGSKIMWAAIAAVEATVAAAVLARGTTPRRPPIARIVTRAPR